MKEKDLLELKSALTFYSDVLETLRKGAKLNKDLIDAQEHLVYSIEKIKKVLNETKSLRQTTGE